MSRPRLHNTTADQDRLLDRELEALAALNKTVGDGEEWFIDRVSGGWRKRHEGSTLDVRDHLDLT